MDYAIIAAGQGSRLAAEGIGEPKPLVRLCGETLLGRLTAIFARCGADRVNIIANESAAAVHQAVARLAAGAPVPVNLIVKTTPDSMHSFAEVTRGFTSKFIVTTVDTVFAPEAFAGYAAAFAADTHCDGFMGVTDYVEDEKPLWVDTDPAGTITAFADTNPSGTIPFVSAGVYGLGPKALAVLHRCLADGTSRMRNYQRALLDAGLRLRAFNLGKVIDIDHESDIRRAQQLLQCPPTVTANTPTHRQ